MTRSNLRSPASIAEELADAGPEEIRELLDAMSPEDAMRMLYDWNVWARGSQKLPEGDWFIWLNLSGRGSGKTRTGAETIRQWRNEAAAKKEPIRIAIVGQTAADVRDVMLRGESGLLTVSPPWEDADHQPAHRRIVWPDGSEATLFFGDSPDQLRGPQFHKAWVDELAKYQYPQETWDNLEFGLRLGDNPQVIVTTTPRPIPIIKQMLEDEGVRLTTGSSYENISNLSPNFIKRVIKKYEGTRVGRQELHAEVLMDMPGALWTSDTIEACRVTVVPDMVRIVVAVDPAVTSHEESAETGIVVCGKGIDGRGYVLRDYSGRYTPAEWAAKVVGAYNEFDADLVVGEVNNGGDLVEANIRNTNKNVSYATVRASRGKLRRAEPIASLYERRLILHHGQFADMEDQMTTYNPEEQSRERRGAPLLSPDRMDAMVWGMTELFPPDGSGQDNDDDGGWRAVKR